MQRKDDGTGSDMWPEVKGDIMTTTQDDETKYGQLIAELGKFGGFDKKKASQLARILLPLIADRERQAYKQGYIDGGIATLTNPKQQTGEK